MKYAYTLFAIVLLLVVVPAQADAAYCPQLSATVIRSSKDIGAAGQVRELQKFLSSYYAVQESDIVTGFFGPTTQQYVMKLQADSALPSAGIVGPLTRALIAKLCVSKSTTNSVVPTTPATPTVPPVSPSGVSMAVSGATASSIKVSFVKLPVNSKLVFVYTPTQKVFEAQSTMVWGGGNGAFEIPLSNDLYSGTYVIRVVDYFTKATIAESKEFVVVGKIELPTITFGPADTSISSGQSVALTWTVKNAQRCVLQYGSTEEVVGLSGSKSVSPSSTTDYKLWCANDSGAGKDGPSASALARVTITNPLASCTLSADRDSYRVGDQITYTWTSINATYAAFEQDTSGKDYLKVPLDKLSTSGSVTIPVTVSGLPAVKLWVYGANSSAWCSRSVYVY